MQLIFNIKENNFQESVITIGNFDGVHKGHQAILKRTKEIANKLNLLSVVVIFEPQPLEYFQPDNKALIRLSTLRDKVCDIEKFGIDIIYCLRFNEKLASMEPQEFINTFIINKLNTKHIIIGKDFKFGKNRSGDINLLKTSVNNQATVEIFDDFLEDATRVSSTKIRESLLNDDLKSASLSLGHPYWVHGKVITGNQKGRQWGIPTANLKLTHKKLPLKGVFCVKVAIDGSSQEILGVANIGTRPTINGSQNLLEVHLLDFDDVLYGKILKVSFLHKLRDEEKFSSIESLIAQIRQDISNTRNYFRACND